MDSACASWDDNSLGFIEWAQCTSRTQELAGVKKDPTLKVDANGNIRLTAGQVACSARLASDLQIKQALTRRGLAYDLSGMIGFHTHDTWINKLFYHLQLDPPPGYAPTSMEQLMRADQALFVKMGEWCRTGVRTDAQGFLPAELAMNMFMSDPTIIFHLLPLPGRAGPSHQTFPQQSQAGGSTGSSSHDSAAAAAQAAEPAEAQQDQGPQPQDLWPPQAQAPRAPGSSKHQPPATASGLQRPAHQRRCFVLELQPVQGVHQGGFWQQM